MAATQKQWTLAEILEVYHTPLLELVFQAATVHRQHHNPREVQISISNTATLATGAVPPALTIA